jgi:MSHA biogenesis protein MshJ
MTLKARLRKLAERINGLSLRERALLMLAVFAVIFLLWDFSTMQPLGERQQAVRAELENVRERVGDLTRNLQQLASERGRDPNRELSAERDALQAEIDRLEQRLAQRHGGIARAEESVSVLAGLLARRAGVDIVELENLPPDRLESASGNPVPGLFVHRVRVVIESDFEGIRNYLDRTAELPRGVFWESLDLTVEQWPTNRIELMLYSVTLDDRWLGV